MKIITKKRYSITLSEYMWDLILKDMQDFNHPKRNQTDNLSGFLNQIFINHYQSINFNPVSLIKRRMDSLIKKIPSRHYNYINGLLQEVERYNENLSSASYYSIAKNKTFNFLMNKETRDVIELVDLESYKNRVSYYLKSVFQSYAVLTKIQREQIYFKNTLSVLNRAIEKGIIVKIKTIDGSVIIFHPYEYYEYKENSILILGYKELNSLAFEKDELYLKKVHLYLKNIQLIQLTDRSFSLDRKKQSISNFDEFKKTNLSDEKINKYIVQLDKQGIKQYQNQYLNRPTYEKQSINDFKQGIFTFKITESELLKYFLNFGPNAKILEPKETAELFREIFRLAYLQYNDE